MRKNISVGRVLALALLVAIIVVASLRAHDASTRQSSLRHSAPTQIDPLAAALAHCQSLGGAAIDDPDCQDVWAENRRRFFDTTPAAPLSAAAPSAIVPSKGK